MLTLMRLKQSRAARNAAASYFAFFSASTSGLLMIPVAVTFLQKEELGLWAVVNAIVGYLMWLDLGVGPATGRKIADAIAAGDRTEINRWWTATRVVLGVQALLVIVLGTLCIPLILAAFNVPAQLTEGARVLLFGSILIAGLSMPLRGVPGLLTAQERFHWIPLGQGVTPWINLGVFYLMLRLGWGLNSYIWSTALTQLATWGYFSLLVRTSPAPPRWDWRGVSRSRLRSLFGFSLSLSAVGLMEAVLISLPALVLARMGGLAAVPVYTFTVKAPTMIVSLVQKTNHAFYPRLQALYVKGERKEFLKKHRQVGQLTLAVGLAASCFVLLFNRTVVEFLAGPEFYAGGITNVWFSVMLIVLPISAFFQGLLQISGSMGKAGLIAFLKTGIALVAFPAAYAFYGLPGLAAVFALQPLISGTYGYLRGSRNCGFSPADLSRKLLWRAGFAAILVALLGFAALGQLESGQLMYFGDRRFSLPSYQNIILCLPLLLLAAYLMTTGLLRLRQQPDAART